MSHDNSGSVVAAGAPATDPRNLTSGSWTYRVHDGALSWSDSLYGVFGFGVHEVVPTLSLMSTHQHPEDRVSWDQTVRAVLTAGNTRSVWHRIIDARTQHRTLHTFLQGTVDDGGAVVELSGLMIDLTHRLEQDRALAATAAVARSAQSRGVIDQAKGVIMATMNVDEQAAFELLRWHSSHLNVKLREVADAVVTQLAELTKADPPSAPRERLTRILSGLAATRLPVLAAARSISEPAKTVDIDQEMSRTAQISRASLPRTMIRAVAAAAQSISIADYDAPDQPLVYVNRAFETLTGYSAAEILGRNCRFLQEPADADSHAVIAQLRTAITAGAEIRTVLRNYRKDGTAFWNELHLSAVRDDTGRITHYIGYQSDVSERVQREGQLEHLAFHDARTNLPNQAAAALHLQRLLAGDETDRPSAWRFHLSGFRAADGFDDPEVVRAVLATAAQRLQVAFPPPTYVAKLEEDTFLVVLTGTRFFDAAAQTLADPIETAHEDISLAVRVDEVGLDAMMALVQTTG